MPETKVDRPSHACGHEGNNEQHMYRCGELPAERALRA